MPHSLTSHQQDRPWFSKECREAIRLWNAALLSFSLNPKPTFSSPSNSTEKMYVNNQRGQKKLLAKLREQTEYLHQIENSQGNDSKNNR